MVGFVLKYDRGKLFHHFYLLPTSSVDIGHHDGIVSDHIIPILKRQIAFDSL